MGDEIVRPRDVTGIQPAGYKMVAAVFSEDLLDQGLIRLGGSCSEG
jgi:hypothetical protein